MLPSDGQRYRLFYQFLLGELRERKRGKEKGRQEDLVAATQEVSCGRRVWKERGERERRVLLHEIEACRKKKRKTEEGCCFVSKKRGGLRSATQGVIMTEKAVERKGERR